MKKLLFVCLALVFVCAMIVPQAAAAQKKEKKEIVKEFVCHITEIDCDSYTAFGHVLLVL